MLLMCQAAVPREKGAHRAVKLSLKTSPPSEEVAVTGWRGGRAAGRSGAAGDGARCCRRLKNPAAPLRCTSSLMALLS